MDLDPGPEAAPLRSPAAQQVHPAAPEPPCRPVEQHGVKARIVEDNLEPAAGRRIAGHDSVDFFAQGAKHAVAAPPSRSTEGASRPRSATIWRLKPRWRGSIWTGARYQSAPGCTAPASRAILPDNACSRAVKTRQIPAFLAVFRHRAGARGYRRQPKGSGGCLMSFFPAPTAGSKAATITARGRTRRSR